MLTAFKNVLCDVLYIIRIYKWLPFANAAIFHELLWNAVAILCWDFSCCLVSWVSCLNEMVLYLLKSPWCLLYEQSCRLQYYTILSTHHVNMSIEHSLFLFGHYTMLNLHVVLSTYHVNFSTRLLSS